MDGGSDQNVQCFFFCTFPFFPGFRTPYNKREHWSTFLGSLGIMNIKMNKSCRLAHVPLTKGAVLQKDSREIPKL